MTDAVRVPVGVGVGVGVGVAGEVLFAGVAAAGALTALVEVADADGLAVVLVGVAELDAGDLAGAGVAFAVVELAELAFVVGDGLAVVAFAVEVLAGVLVGVGVLAGVDVLVAVGVGVVGAGVAVALSASHDWPPDTVAALAGPLLAVTARVTPEAAVIRTLPAISVTVAGRAGAKRMKRPNCAARCDSGTTIPVRQWLHEVWTSTAPVDATRSPYPSVR